MDNSAQAEYWNTQAGLKWVREARQLDAMLAPFSDAVLNAAQLKPGERVLDVGCGAGALSLQALQTVPSLAVTGVDISAPLTELARTRAAEASVPAEFVVADAASWRAPELQDVLISRFGVMFFAEPGKAFANLRANMKPTGRLAFACWRPFAENPWAMAPLQVALPFLKAPPAPTDPRAPGPFAFADADWVSENLHQAGWKNVTLTPWSGEIVMPGDREEVTAGFMMDIGPLGRLLAEQQADADAVKAALMEFLRAKRSSDGCVRLGAAVWIVTANA